MNFQRAIFVVIFLLLAVNCPAQRWHSLSHTNTAIATSPSSGLHFVSTNGWLIQSWDNGITWQHEQLQQTLDLTLPATEDLSAICFSDSATGLILGSNHLFRTSDGGRIWTTLRYPGYEVYSNLCALSNGTFCFIDSKGRFFSGQNVFDGRVINDTDYLMSLQSTTDHYLIARTLNTDLIESSDGGMTWTVLPQSDCDAASFTDHLDGVSIHDNKTFATHDGGATWSVISSTRSDYPIRLDSELILFRTFVYNTQTGILDSVTTLNSPSIGYTFVRLNGVVFAMAQNDLLRSLDTGRTGTEVVRNPSGSNIIARNAYDLSSVDWGNNQQYRSLDSGMLWSPVAAPSSTNSILFLDEQTGVLVGQDTVFRTTNGGNSWTTLALQHTKSGTFGNAYACASGVFITGNGGPWFTSDFNSFRVSSPCHLTNRVDTKGDTILVAGYDSVLNTVLVLSSDAGMTWKNIGVGTGWIQYIGSGVIVSSVSGTGLSISTNYGNTWNVVFPGAGVARFLNSKQGVAESTIPGQIYSTTDGGATWRHDHFDVPPASTLFDLTFPGNAYGFTDGYRAGLPSLFSPGVDTVPVTPELKWVFGQTATSELAVGEAPDGSLLEDDNSAGHVETLKRSTNFGVTWTSNSLNYDPEIRHYISRGSIVYAIGINHLLRSTNNGASWTNFFFEYYGYGETTDAIFTPAGKLLVATSDGLFRSTYSDTTFARKKSFLRIDSGITDTILPHHPITWLAKDSSGVLFAMNFDSVFRSTDDGLTWTVVLRKLKTEQGFSHLCVAPDRSIYICSETGVLRSQDGGNQWVALWPPSTESSTVFSRIEACNDSTFLVTTTAGAFFTRDSGLHWSRFDTLQAAAGDIIKTHDGHLIGATGQFGLVRTALPFTNPTASVSEPATITSSHRYTAYPNPSKGTVTLYPLPSARNASIFDDAGRFLGERLIDPSGGLSLNLPAGHYWIDVENDMIGVALQ